jgi:hypothetical protein
MGMQEQPDGVHRRRRGGDDGKQPLAYDILLGGQYIGWVERLNPGKPGSNWRAYPVSGAWPRKFSRPGGYLASIDWLLGLHRSAKLTTEPVTAAEGGRVRVLSPIAADPFRGEPFADPLS